MNRNRNFNTIFVTTFIAFFTVSRAYDNGARFARLPTLGWSSWVALGPGAEDPVFDYCDEFSIKAAADAFIEVGLFDAGYRHFHLDDCWAGTSRNATGYLIPEADHFPNGMKPVVDYVNSKGLVFGLYTCGGPKTCVGNREGSQGHWEQDAQLFAEWGVEWVKMDWCGGVDILGSYGNMSKALNATGKPIVSIHLAQTYHGDTTTSNPYHKYPLINIHSLFSFHFNQYIYLLININSNSLLLIINIP